MSQRESFVPELGADQARAERKQAAAERFRQQQYIGPDALVFTGKQPPGPPESRLNLVDHEGDAVQPTKPFDARQVTLRRLDDATFSLDRLDEKRRNAISLCAQTLLERIGVAKRQMLNAARKWPEAIGVLSLPGQGKGAERL